MYVVVFSEEKSPELPKHLPNQHADIGENQGEIPSTTQAEKFASTTARTPTLLAKIMVGQPAPTLAYPPLEIV